MDSFFSLIFENFFIVIIIIVAVVNFLSKAKGTSESSTPTDQSDEGQKQRKTIQEVFEEKIEQAKDSYQQAKDTITEEVETQAEKQVETIEEQRQKQYNQLKQRIQTEQPMEKEEKEYQKQFEKRVGLAGESQDDADEELITNQALLQNKLTKQGLAESIVMAEVLGPPRALNPYQNVAMKRMRK